MNTARPLIVGVVLVAAFASGFLLGKSVPDNSSDITAAASSASVTVNFSTDQTVVAPGTYVTLSWTSIGATSCGAGGAWNGTLPTSGSKVVIPRSSSSYSVMCWGGYSQVEKSVTVQVTNAVTTSPLTTTWAKCADEDQTCNLNGTATVRYGSGTKWVTKQVNGSVLCANSVFGDPLYGTVKECDAERTDTAPAPTPTILRPNPAPKVSLTASVSSVPFGGSATLNWSSTDVTSCSASGSWSGTEAVSGTYTLSNLSSSGTYILSCTGSGGTASQSVSVSVLQPPLTTPTPSSTVTYDTSIGMGVDANGFAKLPLRSGAHRYFVNSQNGSDANGCTAAQSPSAPLATMVAGINCLQAGVGDQVLLAEGTHYAEALPWLAFKGGYNAQYPTVIESYDPADPTNATKYGRGDQRNARPALTAHQTQVSNGTFAYLSIRGLDFNAGNSPDQGLTFIGNGSYLLFENNIFRYQGLSYDSAAATPTPLHVIIRNNSLYGMWSTGGRTGGLYAAGVDGITVEDNVFWHCGWKIGANRDDALSVGGATVFSHSFYLQTNTFNGIVRRNLSADGAGDGGIARGDINYIENLSIDNPAFVGLGGGPAYGTDRPAGVNIQASYNAAIGDADVTSLHTLGWGINTTNGISGSRVYKNLLVRTRNPHGPSVSGFSTGSFFPQPSYTQYDHNVLYKWAASGQTYWTDKGTYSSLTHVTYDHNVWGDPSSGTNINEASYSPPNPYTAAQLYAALGYPDKASFINYAINHPEAHIQRTARTLLFTGYGM